VAQEGSVVDTTTGPIRGRVFGGAHVFAGIPYGSAARFRPPLPAAPWEHVRAATSAGPRAVQATSPDPRYPNVPKQLIDYFAGGDPDELGREVERDDEDCLVLNVVTPRPDDAARPVMVYVHGGGFDSGSGYAVLGGTGLAVEEDVVVVGVNHRLNVFGFLHLAELDESFADSRNVGMLDLVLALQWLQENIARFGGDPRNVTIFGESGGGMKISTLMAVPEAVGLFHKAIVQSGPGLTAIPADVAGRNAERLLASCDAKPGDLLAMPAAQLFDAWRAAKVPMGPVIDGHVLPRAPFDPDAPASAADVPLLIGHTLDEVAIFLHFVDDASLMAANPVPAPIRQCVDGAYEAAFPHLTPRRRLVRAMSDLAFGIPTGIQAERKAAQRAPVYKYVIGYEPPILDHALGSFHGMDVSMVLRAVAFPECESFSKTIASAWAAFARTGDPSTPEVAWPRFDPVERTTIVLDDESKAVRDPFAEIRAAWGQNPPTRSLTDMLAR
jgi:para-nitrobenzyl esterase